jgi:hypothetical protein
MKKIRYISLSPHIGQPQFDGGDEKCIENFVGKLLEKRSLGDPRWKCEDNIRVNLSVTDCEDRRWMELAQDGIQ